jgi:hypothetical protein
MRLGGFKTALFICLSGLWCVVASGCQECCPPLEGPSCYCFDNGSKGRVCEMGCHTRNGPMKLDAPTTSATEIADLMVVLVIVMRHVTNQIGVSSVYPPPVSG